MPIKTEFLEIDHWKGMRNYGPATDYDPRDVYDCANIDFDEDGTIEKRRGTKKVSITLSGSGSINCIYDFQCQQGFTAITDQLRTVIVRGDVLHVVKAFDQVTQTIEATFSTSNALHYGVSSNNGQCFLSNENGEIPQLLCYVTASGTTAKTWVFRSAALDSPTSVATCSAGSTGSCSGDYRARYTYVDYFGSESNPSNDSNAITLSSQSMTVEVIGSQDATIAFCNLYVLPPNCSTYRFSRTFPNSNATTSYTTEHTVTDGTLAASAEIEEDHWPCPKGKYVTIYNDLLLVAGSPELPDIIYPSNWQKLRQFSLATDFARATSGDGQPIMGFGRAYDDVVIGKADSLFLASGSDNTTFAARPHNNEYGVYGQLACSFVWQRFAFFSDDGIYVDDGLVPKEISRPIRNRLRTLNAANMSCRPTKIVGANYRYYKKLYWSVKDRATDGDNDRLIIYNYELGTWTQWTGATPKYMAAVQNQDDYEYLYGGDASGNIWQYTPPNGGLNQDFHTGSTTSYTSWFETPWISPAKSKGDSDWDRTRHIPRWIKLYAGGEYFPTGATFCTLQTEYMIDFNDSVVATFSTTHATTLWPAHTIDPKTIHFGGKIGTFNWIKIRITNTDAVHWKLPKVTLGYRPKPEID